MCVMVMDGKFVVFCSTWNVQHKQSTECRLFQPRRCIKLNFRVHCILFAETMLSFFFHIWFVYVLFMFMCRLKTENEYIRLICVSFRRTTHSPVTWYAVAARTTQQYITQYICRWRWRWSALRILRWVVSFTTAWQVREEAILVVFNFLFL